MKDLCYMSNEAGEVPVPFQFMGECSGITALAQKAITLLLTNSTDDLRFGVGGGLGELVGRSAIANDNLKNLITAALARTSGQLRDEQAGDQKLTAADKLSKLVLESAEQARDSVVATIAVVSEAGESTYAILTTGQQA